MTVSGGRRAGDADGSDPPVDAAEHAVDDPRRGGSTVSEGPGRPWVARLVTYGLVAGLALGALAEVEHWPVTSFRLFSSVRTDRSFGLELVAVDGAGGREPVRLTGGSQVVANASHQLQQLRADAPAVRRRKVLAWLALTGMDPGAYRTVRLERVERRLDPEGGPPAEVRRTVVVEVAL